MNERQETEQEELNRGYREYAEVQEKLEQAAKQELFKAHAQADLMLRSFDHFLRKVL
jgi:hypothetical protein